MNKKACELCLFIGSLLMVGDIDLNTPASAKINHSYKPRVKRVANQHQINQHRLNQRRYQQMQKTHLANVRKIHHYQRVHQHHHIQIEKRKIRQIKRQKAAKRHQNSSVVKNRNYHFDENYRKDIRTAQPQKSYHEVAGNDRITFNHPVYLRYIKYTGRRNNHGYEHGDPQSISILPNGHLYVLFNVGHRDSSINRIIEYNAKNGKLIKVGRRFHGGHGQGLSYDYRTHQLWECMNHYRNHGYPRGIIPKVLILSKIDQKKLKPTGHWLKIRTRYKLGENVAYDKSGDYWNVSRNYYKNKRIPIDSLQIYRGQGRKLKMVKDILHSPSACIQNLTYNPDTNRLYVVGNGVIMSFPINNLNHLTNHNIKVAVMNHHSEFEGLAFWNHRAYLLVHPDLILDRKSVV